MQALPHRRIVIAVDGSDGAIYAKLLFDRLQSLSDQWDRIGIVMSDRARATWEAELGDTSYQDYPFDDYAANDFLAPFASGSARYTSMIVCPCSLGLLARIARGISNDLASRAADVILKERRQLLLVPQDAPYNLLHLRNMTALTEAGAIICPASPSFHDQPQNVEALAATVVDRVLRLVGIGG